MSQDDTLNIISPIEGYKIYTPEEISWRLQNCPPMAQALCRKCGNPWNSVAGCWRDYCSMQTDAQLVGSYSTPELIEEDK